MPRRRLLLPAFVAVVALLSAPGALSASGAGALRICSGCASTGGDLSHYRYVILNSWDRGRIPALKAAHPDLKILVYKDASFAVDYVRANDEYLPGGVNYWTADAAWFLRDAGGARVSSGSFPQAWMMDVGRSDYQEKWLSNVLADLRGGGWDGVLLDDVNESMDWHLRGRALAKYPTRAAWYGAMRSFNERVGPAISAQGFLAVANINFDCWAPCWRDYLQFFDGAAREWWSKNGTDATGHYAGEAWDWANSFLRITQQAGKFLLPITYAPKSDVRSMRYAQASFLIDWDGGRSALVFQPTDPEAQDPHSAAWMVDIGRPVGAREQTGTVLRRAYSDGLALVNISEREPQTVDLGRPYVAPDGGRVTSVTLRPLSGLVLHEVGRSLSSRAEAPAIERHDATRLTERMGSKLRGSSRAFRRG